LPISVAPLCSYRQYAAGGPRQNGRRNSKMKEQTGNVIENKGLLWKTREQTGNVYENK
jgi:hypothetical protein